VGLHLRFNFLNKYSHPRSQSLCSNVRSDEYCIQKIKQISDSMKAYSIKKAPIYRGFLFISKLS